LGRIIGLIGCTCLVIAVLRLTNMEHVTSTIKGGVERAAAARGNSPREQYRRGKELYLRGLYHEAVLALEAATASGAGLSALEKQQATDYLIRAQAKLDGLPAKTSTLRGQSPDDEAQFAAPMKDAAGRNTDAVRTRVERLMTQAQQALKHGQNAEARKLAQQAVQLAKNANLKFDSRDVTPAQILARIDAAGKPSASSGAIQHAGGELPENSAVELTAGESEEPAEEISPWTDSEDGEASAEIAGDLSPEQLARQLVASARADLDAGRYAEARRKALQADELDIPWTLFEDQPILILEAVDDRSGSTTLAQTNGATRRPVDAPAVDQDVRKSALALLQEARDALEAGRPDEAREKALAAQDLKVVYKQFDDRPELVLQDIEIQPTASSAGDDWSDSSGDSESVTPETQQRKAQLKSLLAEARQALEAGDLDTARKLALEAESLDVPLGVFDDSPDHVLADIARSVREQSADSGEQPDGQTGAAAPRSQGASLAAKKLAAELLKQSRALLAAGRLDEALMKARKAESLNVPFDVVEDRPDAVIADIEAVMGSESVAAHTPTADPEVQTAASGSDRAFDESPEVKFADGEEVLAPIGSSAIDYYNRGMAELSKGDRAAAYDAFVAAHQTGEKLDRIRAQRLQDFLRELAPRGRNVRPANHQVADADPDAEFPAIDGEQPNIIDSVEQQLRVKHDRMRSDVLNAVFKAERLREKDPEKGLAVIDEAIATVEQSDLTGAGRDSLLRTLQRTRDGLNATIAQQQPNIEQNRKNEEVRDKIETRFKNQIRIEQEYAKLVEEFNELMEQRQYAEAEAKAKMAKELNPNEPTAVVMVEKAKFARRVEFNEKLREDKADSFLRQLDDVETASIVPVGDGKVIDYGDDWGDLTIRRKDKYRHADNHIRSPLELEIEQSLGKRVSLHEDQVPLSEVLQKIGALGGFSIYIDDLGLADEDVVATETPVTINVESITIKSALNLLLERHNLGFTIQDEVLKITSRMRQQGELVARTYNVADLVVPIPSVIGAPPPGLPGISTNAMSGIPGAGGAQFSVPANGVPGQALAQVGPNADLGALGLGGNNSRTAENRHDFDFDSLNDLIISTIEPDSWDAVGGQATIRHYETTMSLVIRQTQRIHEEIADLLGQLRRLQDLQVTVECRFVTVTDRFFERVGLDFDFNVPDTLGPAEFDNIGNPIPQFGNILLPAAGQAAANQQGQQGQQQGQNQQGQQQQGVANFLQPDPQRQLIPNNFATPTVVGLSAPGQFQQNYDIPFQQGSFEVGVPTFGGFNPSAGVQVGFAILSDIEAFFFIQAAQADQRNNLLFAPKVTLFNGQTGTVFSGVSRPFVISLIPTVGFFSTGFQPVIQTFFDGVSMTVTAVISADRRYVRLTVIPIFNNITDVFTFSFIGGTAGGGQQGQGGGQQLGGGGQQFGIGGGMGTTQLLQSAITQFGGNQGGGGQQQGQQGQQNQQGNAVTVTVQQPVQETVTVFTTVSVPDGGTVLLGGVKRLREGRSMAGVPILNKIPYINRLFKNTGVGRETESLMLMVTPRIIIQEEEEEMLGIPTN
jgi:hypothetical protein